MKTNRRFICCLAVLVVGGLTAGLLITGTQQSAQAYVEAPHSFGLVCQLSQPVLYQFVDHSHRSAYCPQEPLGSEPDYDPNTGHFPEFIQPSGRRADVRVPTQMRVVAQYRSAAAPSRPPSAATFVAKVRTALAISPPPPKSRSIWLL